MKLAPTVLGHIPDEALRALATTTVVVKRKTPIHKGIVCCVDGSGRAFSALDQLLRFMRDSDHEIFLVHAVAEDSDRADWADGVEQKSMEMASGAPGMERAQIHYEKLECDTSNEVRGWVGRQSAYWLAVKLACLACMSGRSALPYRPLKCTAAVLAG